MNFKCLECGHIFEEGEQIRWTEPHGEVFEGCPVCESAFERTHKCISCNGEYLEHELSAGVCENCVSKYSDDVDMCFKISETATESVNINAFLAHVYDEKAIEEILLENLKETILYNKEKVQSFYKEDEDWFVERLAEVLRDEK